MIRAAVGLGANYRASCRARSRAEFIARVGIALEEADESAFWLEIIQEGELAPGGRGSDLLDEAYQLTAILAASRITASRRRQSE
jgi:four helix bundle protein